MTWACAATGRRMHTANAADKQCSDQGRMHLSFSSSAPLRRPIGYAPSAHAGASLWGHDSAETKIISIGLGTGGRVRGIWRSTGSLIIGLRVIGVVVWGGCCGTNSSAGDNTCRDSTGSIIGIGATVNVSI